MTTITNIRALNGAGVLADRTSQTPSINFLRFNLIYGFNGSGKSTVSRLFSSLQKGQKSPRLPEGCTFEFELSDGTRLASSKSLASLEKRVCVFNADFIEENLQWGTGLANPIFYIGAEQAELAAKLQALEGQLPGARVLQDSKTEIAAAKEKSLGTYKRERARTISDRLRQTGRKYEAPQLSNDYKTVDYKSNSILSDSALETATATCARNNPLPKLEHLKLPIVQVKTAIDAAIEIGPKTIAKVAIEDLETYPEMTQWVKTGHEYHEKHALASCLHCGEPISKARRELLARAFDESLNRFVDGIREAKEQAWKAKGALDLLGLPSPSSIAETFRADYEAARGALVATLQSTRPLLEWAIDTLSTREATPTTPVTSNFPEPSAVNSLTQSMQEQLVELNRVIDQHNAMESNFADHQEGARLSIRRHFLADGASTYFTLESEQVDAATEADQAKTALEQLNEAISKLRSEVQKHGPVAAKINDLIKSYLGHQELTIVAVEKGYELHRHGKLVHGTPSEGEKTAIALCYFLSTLGSEGRKIKDLIVVVDDPISSLDTKAMNYACALIRSSIEEARQIIVLTHNSHCMNEFKKAWKGAARADNNPTARLLYLDVAIPTGSPLRLASVGEMSRLLREYDSEYHFLFQKVMQFQAAGDGHFDYAFMMPNVIRRVLEVFLAFRIPRNGPSADKIRDLCKKHGDLELTRLVALDRLSQVESHSDSLDDLISHSSMTLEETRNANLALLDLMAKVDPEHLAGLRKYCGP